jgi:hypothetical protein
MIKFNTIASIHTPTNSPRVFKDFKELTPALWQDSSLSQSISQNSNGEVRQPRYYGIVHASVYLGKSEGAFRQFLAESGLKPDVTVNGREYFSEEYLDLIESYGYLFESSKIWRKTGHHEQADHLRREAELIFGLPSSSD